MEISSWLAQMQARILQTFGERVAFIGLQGSFARGEAGPDSDIDLVVILDAVVLEDLARYRALLEEMPLRERSCGFIACLLYTSRPPGQSLTAPAPPRWRSPCPNAPAGGSIPARRCRLPRKG